MLFIGIPLGLGFRQRMRKVFPIINQEFKYINTEKGWLPPPPVLVRKPSYSAETMTFKVSPDEQIREEFH